MHTFSYKCGFIHENFQFSTVRVQVDKYAYPIEVKSIHAAKMLITKHVSKITDGYLKLFPTLTKLKGE